MRDVLALANVVYLDADEVCNCIAVGVSDLSASSAVAAFAANAGVPASSVKTVATSPIVTYSSLRDGIRPIKGGLQIQNTASGYCTMMATVFNRARSKKGLLTCSHCTPTRTNVDGTDFFQAGGALFSGDFVGKEVVDPAVTRMPGCPSGRLCRHSDVAYAEFSTSTVGIVGKLARPKRMCQTSACDLAMDAASDSLDIVGLAGQPAVGEVRHKIGRTTGWTSGATTRTCVDVNVFGTSPPITMLCQHIVAASSDGGDSGSPVFELVQGDRAVLAGILWGGTLDNASFAFSAMPDIESEMGTLDFF